MTRSASQPRPASDLKVAIRKLLAVARKVQRKEYERMAIKARAYGEDPNEYATAAYCDARHAISYAEHALMEAKRRRKGGQP